jgi:short-subunit dehydrogenase
MDFLTLVGLFIVLRTLYHFVRKLYIYDLLRFFNIYRSTSRLDTYLRTRDGTIPWAFVTNIGNEVGKSFAETLAAYGFNIVLHDAEPLLLYQLETALQNRYSSRQFRTVVTHPVFYFDNKYADFVDIQKTVHGLSLKVFINNVGSQPTSCTDTSSADDDYSEQDLSNGIKQLAVFPTAMMSILTPKLAACTPSLVLNVEAPQDPDAQMIPVDPPCKAYLRALTMQLALEMKARKRDVEVINIRVGQLSGLGGTGSGGKSSNTRNLFRPSVDKFVEAALVRVGCGETVLIPHFWHELMSWCLSLLPDFVRDALHVRMLRDQNRRSH